MGKRLFLELRLNELMTKENDTIKSLSETLRVSEGDILDWMNGDKDIPVKCLKQLAGHYKCSTDYLLGRTDTFNVEQEIEDLKNTVNSDKEKIEILQNKLENYEKRYGKLEIAKNGVETFGNWILNNFVKVFLTFFTGVLFASIVYILHSCF